MRIVGRGDVFGEEALFDDRFFSSTATALRDGAVAVCTVARLQALIARYPALSMNLAQLLRENHNRMLDRLEQLVHKPVRQRLLSLLQDLAMQGDDRDMQAGKYEVNLTHVELASLIGSTRETVSSELSKLASAGLIEKRGRKVIIDLVAREAA